MTGPGDQAGWDPDTDQASGADQPSGADQAIRVLVPEQFAETAGAVLMGAFGPFEEQREDDLAVLIFYPSVEVEVSLDEILAVLPTEALASGRVRLETQDVSRDWVNGWKDHFRPIVIDKVRIRPPWEPEPEDTELIDVVINPGLGFGTGLHPTTRGTLQLLQDTVLSGSPGRTSSRGPLVDSGTGSGILAISAVKLGWDPVIAFDNDPVALTSARENIGANGVGHVIELHHTDVGTASPQWFAGATVLANMTLGPVLVLLRKISSECGTVDDRRLAMERPRRVVVSGILAGTQEQELLDAAGGCGLACGARTYEAEWVSMELVPVSGGEMPCTHPGAW